MPSREIARARGMSLDATKFHVANIISKLEASRRADLRHWRGNAIESAFSKVRPGTKGNPACPKN